MPTNNMKERRRAVVLSASVPLDEAERVWQAADAVDQTVSMFVREAAIAAANRTLSAANSGTAAA